jgi:hypothetical protein
MQRKERVRKEEAGEKKNFYHHVPQLKIRSKLTYFL